jgi:hypothetical protein
MRRRYCGARLLVGVGLLLALAWLLAPGARVALAAPALTAAVTPVIGTPATTPTILPAPTTVALPADSIAPAGPPVAAFAESATLTCGAALVALVITVVSLLLLLRSGYGPFLRVLLRGSTTVTAADLTDDTRRGRHRAGRG